ncbi:hypothetical protein [Alcaligenes faecalis]|uniref:hypothetical protein n=1 Tax=Alcaligenes faecalis TaxID=511 RepID=UPI001C82C4A1|nr:hypothetical protein [Alcaligenes faecalis]MBX6965023.1 hypothetical protein [Providencia rettgeri]MBX7031721.1 hypothetical protein [Alcaligenes faecalis]
MRKKKARSDRAELTNDDTDTLKNQHHIEARLETWILIRRPSLGHRSDQKIPAAPTGIRSEVAGEEKRTAGKAALQSYIGSSYINVRNRPERSVPRSTDPCGIYGIFDKNLSDTSPPNFLLNSEARVHFYYSYQ